jgi:glycosyltransferase involved in cell wall biosynthesis
MKISIVITTYKRDDLFRKTLESLSICAVPDCPTKLIVIENGYKGGVEDICKAVRMDIPIDYYYLEEPGTSNSRRYSLGLVEEDEFIIFFDDDITVHKDILEIYYKAFNEFGRGYFYGGRVYPAYEVEPQFKYMQLFPYSVKGFAPFEEITIIENPIFLGANWAVHSSDILLAGNFNPDLGPGGRMGSSGHEYDLQQRLLKKGISGVYLPNAGVWHYVPREVVCFDWLKKRFFKQGLVTGLGLSQKTYGAYWGKVPRWFLREFIGNCVRSLLYVLRPKRDLRYFLAKRKFYISLGVMVYFIKAKKS